MALKIDKQLQREWEKRLAAEGLAPLTTFSDGARSERRFVARYAATSAAQKALTERYYERCHKAKRRIELAHAVWSLHCEGRGRRDIAVFLNVPEKVVRLVLSRLQSIFRLVPPTQPRY